MRLAPSASGESTSSLRRGSRALGSRSVRPLPAGVAPRDRRPKIPDRRQHEPLSSTAFLGEMGRQDEWAEVWSWIVEGRAEREAQHLARVFGIKNRINIASRCRVACIELVLVIGAHFFDRFGAIGIHCTGFFLSGFERRAVN